LAIKIATMEKMRYIESKFIRWVGRK